MIFFFLKKTNNGLTFALQSHSECSGSDYILDHTVFFLKGKSARPLPHPNINVRLQTAVVLLKWPDVEICLTTKATPGSLCARRSGCLLEGESPGGSLLTLKPLLSLR